MALTNRSNFKIGNNEFTPKFGGFKITFESLATDDSGRSADGVMHVDFIFSKMRVLEITMPPMSPGDMQTLLSLVQGKVYNITYFDPLDNAEKTIEVYTSTSSSDCYSGILGTNGLWQNVTFKAIQTGGEQ